MSEPLTEQDDQVLTDGGEEPLFDRNLPPVYAQTVDPMYIYRRSSAADGRQQKNLMFRDEVVSSFGLIYTEVDGQFDRTVRESDVAELLFMLAFRHIDELPEVAKDIGLGISMEEAIARRED